LDGVPLAVDVDTASANQSGEAGSSVTAVTPAGPLSPIPPANPASQDWKALFAERQLHVMVHSARRLVPAKLDGTSAPKILLMLGGEEQVGVHNNSLPLPALTRYYLCSSSEQP
jgi:hypothetical protein